MANLHRLGLLIRCLEEGQGDSFDMGEYGLDCNTPCCVLGHYCARQDLQQTFRLKAFNRNSESCIALIEGTDGRYVDYRHEAILDHFGITREEASDLFSPAYGCGKAQTREQAIDYLRRFIAHRDPRQLPLA